MIRLLLLLQPGLVPLNHHHFSSIASTPASASPVPITIPLPSLHISSRSNLTHLSPALPPHGHQPRMASDTSLGMEMGSPVLSVVGLLPERTKTQSGSGSGRQPIDEKEEEEKVSSRPEILRTQQQHNHTHNRSLSSTTSNN